MLGANVVEDAWVASARKASGAMQSRGHAAIEQISQPGAIGDQADAILSSRCSKLADQQGLPVVGDRGQAGVDLIAEHLAGVEDSRP